MNGKISAISSIVYMLVLLSYFLFGNRNSTAWTVLYFSSTFIYISLILLDKILEIKNIKITSILISSVAFQIFYAIFLIFLGIISKNNVEFTRTYVVGGWSVIMAVVTIIYFVMLKILSRWVNG